MKIGVAVDHAGFPLKGRVIEVVQRLGHEVHDYGTTSTEPVDYPDYAAALGEAVLSGEVDRGVLLCGSGVGASIAACKLKGIRAAVCHDTYSAHQGVEHDDMNVLVLGARIVGSALAYELADAFLKAKFISNEERFTRRFKKVLAIEAKYQRGSNQSNPPA